MTQSDEVKDSKRHALSPENNPESAEEAILKAVRSIRMTHALCKLSALIQAKN
jgi:hypothetical protein